MVPQATEGVGGGLPSGSDLGLSSSPDPISDLPQEEPRARDGGLWMGPDWERKFGAAWCEKYQRLAMGGSVAGSKATGALSEQLEALPRSERLAAQARAPEMFREFLGSDAPDLVAHRHPWPWFVTRFHGLRVPALRVAPRAPASREERNLAVARELLEREAAG